LEGSDQRQLSRWAFPEVVRQNPTQPKPVSTNMVQSLCRRAEAAPLADIRTDAADRAAMNVKELRTIMQAALQQEGLESRQIVPKTPKAWALPADDIIRFFQPHVYRRPWGFVYSGAVGVEVPALREWLHANKRGDEGIFHSCFISYLIVNEDVLRGFMVTHDAPVPTDLWAGLLKDRLEQIPTTLVGLIAAYRRNKEELG